MTPTSTDECVARSVAAGLLFAGWYNPSDPANEAEPWHVAERCRNHLVDLWDREFAARDEIVERELGIQLSGYRRSRR